MRGNKTPFGPEMQSELRGPTWCPPGPPGCPLGPNKAETLNAGAEAPETCNTNPAKENSLIGRT